MQNHPDHHPDPQTTIQLGAGESRLLQVTAGSTLIHSSGALTVTGTPLWLGELVFSPCTRLEPGQVHVIGQDGWITLKAGPRTEAVCLIYPKQALSQVWREAARTLLKRYLQIAGIRLRRAKPASLG